MFYLNKYQHNQPHLKYILSLRNASGKYQLKHLSIHLSLHMHMAHISRLLCLWSKLLTVKLWKAVWGREPRAFHRIEGPQMETIPESQLHREDRDACSSIGTSAANRTSVPSRWHMARCREFILKLDRFDGFHPFEGLPLQRGGSRSKALQWILMCILVGCMKMIQMSRGARIASGVI